jgi:hypothetical protein
MKLLMQDLYLPLHYKAPRKLLKIFINFQAILAGMIQKWVPTGLGTMIPTNASAPDVRPDGVVWPQ